MEKNNKPILTGKALRKPVLLATTLLLTSMSLSACIVAPDRDGDGWGRRHHWQEDHSWNNGPGWQGHGNWNGNH